MSQCRSCNAEIIWLVTSGGKTMPVDASSISAMERDWLDCEGNTLVFDPKRHISHFATCPQAKKWRQPELL